MTWEIATVLVLIVSSVALFATEKVSVDVVALLLVSILVGSRILTPQEAFLGFSNEGLIMLGAIFVMGGALQQSGVLDGFATLLTKMAGNSNAGLTSLIMLLSGGVSAFMNNTTVAAMFVPPVTALARKAGISASKLLMPLAFAAILGGACTLIGTSTNIAVSGYISKSGLEPIGMFEIAPIGLVCLAAGALYMLLLGQRLLPSYENDTVTDPDEVRKYLAEVEVLPGSPLVGEHASDWALSLVDFRLIQISRGGALIIPDSRSLIAEGDVLLVEGKVENLRKLLAIERIEFRSTFRLPTGEIEAEPNRGLAEAVILPGSELCGGTLTDVDFRHRYGLRVLAINRSGQPIFENISDVPLREADVLLVLGEHSRIAALSNSDARFRSLGEFSQTTGSHRRRHRVLALAIFVGALVAGVAGWLPMSGAFLGGAVLVILTGCISAEKAREFIDWRLLILVGGMTAFGTAMEKTGAAQLIAGWLVSGLAPLGVMALLAGFLLLTILLTQPMSNAAAALVVLPIAMSAAIEVGANPRTFAIGIMLAASLSFITPLEPACLLVYGVGKYRFRDFIKVGGLMTILLAAIVLFLLPLWWDINP